MRLAPPSDRRARACTADAISVFARGRRFLGAAAAGALLSAPGLAVSADQRSDYFYSEGPWGRVQCHEVRLEPPTSHLWAGLFDERAFWDFGQLSPEEVESLLVSLSFPTGFMELLRSEGRWSHERGATQLELTNAMIESLSPEHRSALAKWLRINNNEFFSKLLINLEGQDIARLAPNLRPETVARIEQVAFWRGNVLSTMDRAYLLRSLGDDEEEKLRLIRSLFSTFTLIARLEIDENSDLDALYDYWSAGGRNPGVRSVLSGVSATSGIDRVDIVQLLPPLSRKYLFSYVNIRDITSDNTPDCFWISLHFFKHHASPRVLDFLTLNHYLDHDFELVDGDPTFGDVVAFFNTETNSFVHSYVHITDDIAYSKNGASFVRPVTITRTDRMMSVYEDEDHMTTRIYRRKPGI